MAKDISKRISNMIAELQRDELFNRCIEDSEVSEWRVFKKYSKKYLDPTWLNIVEQSVPALEAIVKNPRRFIQTDEDLVETSRARSVSMGTVKYLAQHTQFIQGMDKEDNVIPSKVLNTNREESFQIYENRFAYTLLKKLSNFIRVRFDALEGALNQGEQLEVVVDKKLEIGEESTTIRLDGIIKLPGEHVEKLDGDDMTPLERLSKIKNTVTGLMNTDFSKQMSRSEPVRPPITRTNVILKNQYFKQALVLWEFLQGYDEEGIEVRSVNETDEMNQELRNQYAFITYLNNLFLHEILGAEAPVNTDVGTEALDPLEGKESTINYDDFPKSNIDVEEIKTVSEGFPRQNEISAYQRNEINSAIDRALSQHKLNQIAMKAKIRAKMILEQRKKEKIYRDKQSKIRKKERKLLEQQARRDERLRVREKNELRRQELDRKRVERKAVLQEKRLAQEEKEYQLKEKRLDDIAVKRAKSEVQDKNAFENRARMARDIIEANSLRMKLKSESAKLIDKNIDQLIKDIYRVYKQ